jgi:hypothetical protein
MKQLIMLSIISCVVFTLVLLAGCTDMEPVKNQPEETKLRSIQTIGTGWTYQEVYKYQQDGLISEIQWERNTPYNTQGIEKYVYDNSQRLTSIIREMTGVVAEEIQYQYDGSHIKEASSYYNGVKESYTLYNYAQSGQLIKTHFFRRDPSTNNFISEGEIQYTYHLHGNVHEIKQFVFDSQQSQMKLHTTRTYPEYLLNRMAVLDSDTSLPTVRLQKNLPKKYVLTTPSDQMEITYSYRWMPDGKLLDRMINLPNGTAEQTVFTFYP